LRALKNYYTLSRLHTCLPQAGISKNDYADLGFFKKSLFKYDINTDALNEMLKRVQHDKKKYVIPNLFRNLEFSNDNKLIAFVLIYDFFFGVNWT